MRKLGDFGLRENSKVSKMIASLAKENDQLQIADSIYIIRELSVVNVRSVPEEEHNKIVEELNDALNSSMSQMAIMQDEIKLMEGREKSLKQALETSKFESQIVKDCYIDMLETFKATENLYKAYKDSLMPTLKNLGSKMEAARALTLQKTRKIEKAKYEM